VNIRDSSLLGQWTPVNALGEFVQLCNNADVDKTSNSATVASDHWVHKTLLPTWDLDPFSRFLFSEAA